MCHLLCITMSQLQRQWSRPILVCAPVRSDECRQLNAKNLSLQHILTVAFLHWTMDIKIVWILSLLINLPANLDASPIQPGCLLQVSDSYTLSSAASETLISLQTLTLNRFSLATGYGWHLGDGNWCDPPGNRCHFV